MIREHCNTALIRTVSHQYGYTGARHEWKCRVCGRRFHQRVRKPSLKTLVAQCEKILANLNDDAISRQYGHFPDPSPLVRRHIESRGFTVKQVLQAASPESAVHQLAS